MSPILIVVDTERGHAVIADGYHRACTIYNHNYDQEVPCLLVPLDVEARVVSTAQKVRQQVARVRGQLAA